MPKGMALLIKPSPSRILIAFCGTGGPSWWTYRAEAELLGDHNHVVLLILDGHADNDHDFASIEENASWLITFINREYGGSVLLIGGLSLSVDLAVDDCRVAVAHVILWQFFSV